MSRTPLASGEGDSRRRKSAAALEAHWFPGSFASYLSLISTTRV